MLLSDKDDFDLIPLVGNSHVTGCHLDERQAGKCSLWLDSHFSATILHLGEDVIFQRPLIISASGLKWEHWSSEQLLKKLHRP